MARAIRNHEEDTVRNSIPGGHSTTTGTGELKAVAREAWDVGAHALHVAGNWLDNMRTSRMKDRNQDNQGQGERAQAGYRNGSRSVGGRSEYYGQYGESASADTRGDFSQRHAPWREQGLGSGDYPYDDHGNRAEALRGGYGMDEAERTYGREPERGSSFGSSQQYDDMRGLGGAYSQRDMSQGGSYAQQGYGQGRYPQQGFNQAQGRGYGQERHAHRGDAGGYGQQGHGRDPYGQQDYSQMQGRGYGQGGHAEQGYAQGGYPQQGGYPASQQGHVYGREYGYGQGGMRSGYGEGGWSPQSGQGRSFESRRGLGPSSYTRSDERIREDLNERLMDDDLVDARNITVEVQNGTVNLSGSVDERWEKHRVEDIADACGGVREVRNNIRVGSGSGSPQQPSSTLSTSSSDARTASTSANANRSGGVSKSSGGGTGAGSGTLS